MPLNGDGKTHGTAWSNFSNVVWGTSGVVPGDTLYLCGLWGYGWRGDIGYSGIQLSITGESGGPITLKSYEGDPCTIVTGRKQAVSGMNDNGDGTYYKLMSFSVGGVPWQGNPLGDHLPLTPVSSVAECIATEGSYYLAAEKEIYVNPWDGLDPDIFYNSQSAFDFNELPHYIIDGFPIIGSANSAAIQGFVAIGDHITVRNCKLYYHTGAWFSGSFQYCTFEDNECHYSRNFCYPASQSGAESSSDCIVQRNRCYNMEPFSIPGPDSGCLSWQSGSRNKFLYNYVETRGMGTNVYVWDTQDGEDNEFAFNHIKVTGNIDTDYHRGLDLNGDTCTSYSDLQARWKIHHNIVDMRDAKDSSGIRNSIGIRHKFSVATDPADTAGFLNNIIIGAKTAIKYIKNGQLSYTWGFIQKNNIFADCDDILDSGTDSNVSDWSGLDFDNNIYPTPAQWIWRGVTYPTLAAFKSAVLSDGAVVDENSIQTDNPGFVNSTGTLSEADDFMITPSSLAFNAGVVVDTYRDFWGTLIPQDGKPDIGIHEVLVAALGGEWFLAWPPWRGI
jgi:hypothetical protein